jgi:hypothetical protein
MTVRNRKSRTDAMVLRAYVANILASRTLLEPLSDKQIVHLLYGGASARAVGRARRWVEREYERDRLAGLREWIRRARRGEQPDARIG